MTCHDPDGQHEAEHLAARKARFDALDLPSGWWIAAAVPIGTCGWIGLILWWLA